MLPYSLWGNMAVEYQNSKLNTNQDSPIYPCLERGKVGLTKREYFSVMILQGVLSGQGIMPVQQVVDNSIKTADYLIEALNAESENC